MRITIIALVLGTLAACSPDPNEAANKLFVEAQQMLERVEKQTPEEQLQRLRAAEQKLKAIVANYPTSNLAVQLASGQRVGNTSLHGVSEVIRVIAMATYECLEAAKRGCAMIKKRPDGHFMLRTQTNGIALHMIVDTGAMTVVLNSVDARRLGIDVDRLNYSVPLRVATSTANAASVRLHSLSIGNISLNDVDALVVKDGVLRENLLGMSFLNRLSSYEFTGEYLTLRKN